MPEDAGTGMKARLRADLRNAMKERRAPEVQLIRALIAAIDNAEAPPAGTAQTPPLPHRFLSGSAEAERLLLSRSDLRDLLLAEIDEREHAAAAFERLEKTDRAEALRAEAHLARRYLE
jgi:hypothetical protein